MGGGAECDNLITKSQAVTKPLSRIKEETSDNFVVKDERRPFPFFDFFDFAVQFTRYHFRQVRTRLRVPSGGFVVQILAGNRCRVDKT
jgi:hypothetical protein